MSIYQHYLTWEILEYSTLALWFFISFLLFIIGLKSKWKYSYILKIMGLILFIGFSATIITNSLKSGLPLRYRTEHASREFLYKIRSALWTYAENNNGLFPEDISEIIPEYLATWPENVYTAEPMKNIELGSESYEGDFTYIPVYTDTEITDFFLYLYGRKNTDGMDVNLDGTRDHIILVLTNDVESEAFVNMLENRGVSREEYKKYIN
jgi:hypothetical protein